MRRGLILALLLCLVSPAAAVQPDEILKDPQLETRARTLSRELRCMVCQNQSIDDSDAPLARDLRLLVRERLRAGDTDSQVLAYLTDRYGDFVLLRPRFSAHTAVLWLVPVVLAVIGIVSLVMLARRSRPRAAAQGLSAAEAQRVKELMSGEER